MANRKRGSRSRRGGNSYRNAILISASAFIVLGGIGGFGFAGYQYANTERADENLCFARHNQHQTAIWIDYSLQGMTSAQLRDYMAGALGAYDRTPANGRVMVVTTGQSAHGNLPMPVFTICKPAATEAEQQALGIPVEGKPQRDRTVTVARTTFIKAMEQVIASAGDKDQQAKASPILEQLRAVSRADWYQGASTRSFLAITDGIENSKVGKFCFQKGDMPPFASFSAKPQYQWVKPSAFADTDVRVLLVEMDVNLLYCTNAELRQWWRDYFAGNGAASVDVIPLQPGVGS